MPSNVSMIGYHIVLQFWLNIECFCYVTVDDIKMRISVTVLQRSLLNSERFIKSSMTESKTS